MWYGCTNKPREKEPIMKKFNVGDRVIVRDPSWHYDGLKGTVVKVNKVTLRVQTDPEPSSNFPPGIVVGGMEYFEKMEK
jgi:RNase P/RNase MRP subunit p29